LIGLGRPWRFWIDHEHIAVPDHVLSSHTSKVAFRAIAVANGARITGWGVDRAHDRAVRADTLEGIRAGGVGSGGIQADKGQGDKK